MRLFTAAEQRGLDRLAAERVGLETRVLMETAGAAVAREVLALRPRRVAVFCGPGQNGGDGYVAARFLAESLRAPGSDAGSARVVCFGTRSASELKGAAASAAHAWAASGGETRTVRGQGRAIAVELSGPDVVLVDAVFGTGLSRPPAETEAEAIGCMNAAVEGGARIVSIDVPSGLDADTGALTPIHVAQAVLTVALHGRQRGLSLHPGAAVAGRVVVAPIGIPAALEDELPDARCELIDDAWAKAMLPRRPRTAHKGDFGHVLVLAGSAGKSGAAALVAEAALRAGAGLVTLAARPGVLDRVLPVLPEIMGATLPGEPDEPLGLCDLPALRAALRGKTAFAAGPGIARGPETAALLGELLGELDGSCASVFDADALNAFAEQRERIAEWTRRAGARPVFTPHPVEFCRLTGGELERVEADRVLAAARAAQRFSACLVLKGVPSVIADPEGATALCGAGNPGMATAGSGDVLTGICAAFLARRGGPGGSFERAALAVYVHARAGDCAAEEVGETALTARDLIRVGLPRLLRGWDR